MAGNAPGRAQYTVACSCGASITLDACGFGKPRACRCGATVTVAWGRDPKTRKAVPVAMTQKKAAPKPAAAAPASAPGAPPPVADTLKALCSCGNSKRIPASQRNSPPRCMCGRVMRIEDAPPPVKPIGKIEKFERAKPSAPLLPLHLRAPLKVRLKKGAQFFDCVCGERVVLRTVMDGKPIQCLTCDRFHVIETDAPPPPGPGPTPGAAPRGAAPVPTRPLTLGEFLCQCGEIQPPRTSRTGRDFECKKCGRKGHVEMDKDPETGLPKMRPVFKSGPTAKAAPAAGGAPTQPPPGAPSWACPCGQGIEAHLVLASPNPSCPRCRRTIRLEKWKHPHSTMTMIRPVFGDPLPAPGSPAPPPKPAKPKEDVVAFEELEPFEADFAEAAVFETAAGSSGGDAPPSMDADAQIAPCECGAEILLSATDVGHTIQCPACADMMIVEGVEDARTGVLTISLRVVSAVDDPDWKLEEFQ